MITTPSSVPSYTGGNRRTPVPKTIDYSVSPPPRWLGKDFQAARPARLIFVFFCWAVRSPAQNDGPPFVFFPLPPLKTYRLEVPKYVTTLFDVILDIFYVPFFVSLQSQMLSSSDREP